MIRQIEIQNFKSVQELKLDLGRFNVLIGENGCGKSNVLEGIAMASAAAGRHTDREFMASRGIRVTEPELMLSAFSQDREPIQLEVTSSSGAQFGVGFHPGQDSWFQVETLNFRALLFIWGVQIPPEHRSGTEADWAEMEEKAQTLLPIRSFLIYSPENTALRTFQSEAQILPLGIKGEGLFAHLKKLSAPEHRALLKKISDQLDLIDWFEGFDVPDNLAPGERTLRIRDRYLVEQSIFDQRSANEGFLFLLFYFTLFISPQTPAFFAIDNIDASLNPKLCTRLIQTLVTLAEQHNKQVIVTTHNPAILDGLNLNDDEQRLMVVHRNSKGHTTVRRIEPPKPIPGRAPVRLSEAFLRGYLGGLPRNF
jgi:predicted ATPase